VDAPSAEEREANHAVNDHEDKTWNEKELGEALVYLMSCSDYCFREMSGTFPSNRIFITASDSSFSLLIFSME